MTTREDPQGIKDKIRRSCTKNWLQYSNQTEFWINVASLEIAERGGGKWRDKASQDKGGERENKDGLASMFLELFSHFDESPLPMTATT
jgi:hypothetical protein